MDPRDERAYQQAKRDLQYMSENELRDYLANVGGEENLPADANPVEILAEAMRQLKRVFGVAA